MTRLKRWIKREIIEAMSDKELKNLLRRIEKEQGNIRLICKYCQRNLSINEISIVRFKRQEPNFVCSSTECLKKMGEEE